MTHLGVHLNDAILGCSFFCHTSCKDACSILLSEPGIPLGRIKKVPEGAPADSVKDFFYKSMKALSKISSAMEDANAPEDVRFVSIHLYVCIFTN